MEIMAGQTKGSTTVIKKRRTSMLISAIVAIKAAPSGALPQALAVSNTVSATEGQQGQIRGLHHRQG